MVAFLIAVLVACLLYVLVVAITGSAILALVVAILGLLLFVGYEPFGRRSFRRPRR